MNTLSRKSPARRIGQILVRSLFTGLVYSIANLLAAALPGVLTRLAPNAENAVVWMLTGTFTCLALTPFILRPAGSRLQLVLSVWAALALVRSIGLGIEGALFKPSDSNPILAAAIGILVQLLVAWLAVALIAPLGREPGENQTGINPKRGWWGWAWRVLAVGLAYIIFYFVFGSANALLYTLSFYRDNPQYGLALPPLGAILVAQLIRGPLFGLGAVFLVRTVKMTRGELMLSLGILFFVIGGAAPYVEQVFRTMPLGFNLATLTELLFQNLPTGALAGYLLGAKQKTEPSR